MCQEKPIKYHFFKGQSLFLRGNPYFWGPKIILGWQEGQGSRWWSSTAGGHKMDFIYKIESFYGAKFEKLYFLWPVRLRKRAKNPKNRLRKSFLSGSYKSLKFDQNFPIFPIFDKTDFWQNWQQAWFNCFLDATDSLLHISENITKAQGWRPFIYIVSVFHRDNTTFVSCQHVFNTCP